MNRSVTSGGRLTGGQADRKVTYLENQEIKLGLNYFPY